MKYWVARWLIKVEEFKNLMFADFLRVGNLCCNLVVGYLSYSFNVVFSNQL